MATAGLRFDPLLPEFHENPYPFYHQLRAEDPVHQSPLGFWVLTRYNDVVTVLRDPRFGRQAIGDALEARLGTEPGKANVAQSMLFRDPPDHTRLRALVSRAFTPRVVEGMRRHIQQIVDHFLDRVEGAGAMDVIADLAYPLPVTVICEMLGVPVSDRDTFKQWSTDIVNSLDAVVLPVGDGIIARGIAARQALAEYFRSLVAERRRDPRNDLLSALIAVEEQGDRLTEGELLATCVLLLIAGHETTVNLIGNGMLALLTHPDQLRQLRENPALLPSAVEELLRYDGPVQRTGRIASADAEIGGKTIPKGGLVSAVIGAANRDPAHFPEPDRLDIARRDNHHIAFGFGIHFCLGAPLARVEGQLAIGTLVRRMPKLALRIEKPVWRESSVLRGLKALPVTR